MLVPCCLSGHPAARRSCRSCAPLFGLAGLPSAFGKIGSLWRGGRPTYIAHPSRCHHRSAAAAASCSGIVLVLYSFLVEPIDAQPSSPRVASTVWTRMVGLPPRLASSQVRPASSPSSSPVVPRTSQRTALWYGTSWHAMSRRMCSSSTNTGIGPLFAFRAGSSFFTAGWSSGFAGICTQSSAIASATSVRKVDTMLSTRYAECLPRSLRIHPRNS
ncbi:hypothetical protein BE21_02460 [Sorangium cellulosum]|uniref:Uncharacterized protein n=1 Tax=Sorangium cellulosum TaxID=56 RepID=A0A150TS20_SORCE|nr:hypothetical protein BE21_02460 [Sorangium cellulosum]